MTDSKTFKLDGMSISFEDGDTIMDAALRAGEYIPHLCHNPEFKPHGSCRVCIVEVNGRQVSACTAPATEHSEVDNSSEKIVNQRRALLQMLFVEGNHVCPACEISGSSHIFSRDAPSMHRIRIQPLITIAAYCVSCVYAQAGTSITRMYSPLTVAASILAW